MGPVPSGGCWPGSEATGRFWNEQWPDLSRTDKFCCGKLRNRLDIFEF
jgi:hypothetical protein